MISAAFVFRFESARTCDHSVSKSGTFYACWETYGTDCYVLYEYSLSPDWRNME
jgi:hypothetical protein